jgi:large subunit ribosomal protein L21
LDCENRDLNGEEKLENRMKYAVIHSGGKQYIAREGETLEVDRLPLGIGENVKWDEVLLLVDDSKVTVGDPFIKGVNVKGKVVDQIKGQKILVFKYIPKERYRKRRGHRQRYTRVLIENISQVKPRKKSSEDEAKVEDAEKPKTSSRTRKTSRGSSKAKAEE